MLYIHFIREVIDTVKDYFRELKTYTIVNFETNCIKEELYNIEIDNLLGFKINTDVKYIYEHYKVFDLVWFREGRYLGEINFISFEKLMNEHNELVGIMEEIYDVEVDQYDIAQDILNWYPIFKFQNGDAFCLDLRNGSVVLYEHEVYDSGKNLHGLKIAKSLDDLFDKWEKIHFADIYYWDEICNSDGIDINSELAKKYIE